MDFISGEDANIINNFIYGGGFTVAKRPNESFTFIRLDDITSEKLHALVSTISLMITTTYEKARIFNEQYTNHQKFMMVDEAKIIALQEVQVLFREEIKKRKIVMYE